MAQQTRPNAESPWPIFSSLRAYRPSYLPGDLIAGLTLAAITIPEQMATAHLGGFSPHIGFFAFVAGSIGFAMFGANRFLSCGADSTITPIFASALLMMAAAGSADYHALALALALTVGLILIASSVSRLGWIANLLSTPVTFGFLAGISLHILVSQLPAVLGLPSPGGTMLDRIATLAEQLGEANPYTICIGLSVLAMVMVSEKISAKIPGALIGLVVATLAVAWAGLESKGVNVIGTVSVTLPTPSFPEIGPERWAKLIPLGLLISIVVMVQTAATTRSFPSDPDKPADIDRDFLGAGAGNVLAGLFGSFPVNASPPRTGIVAETGGRTQLSGLFAAAIVVALLAYGTSLLRHIPDAALAGVLLFVAVRIIRFRQIMTVFRQSIVEFWLILATAASIIVLPIEQGAAVGIVLSLLQGIWANTRARLVPFEHVPGTTIWWPAGDPAAGKQISRVAVVGLQAPLTFLNAESFRADAQQFLKNSATRPGLLVLEASGILEIDFTAAQTLRDLFREFEAACVTVAVARLESRRAQDSFERFGLYDVLPKDRIFRSVDDAIRTLAPP